MITYNPILYSNTTLGPIFNEILYTNKTVSNGYVRVLDNIKYKQVVTSVSGDIVLQPYAVTPTVAAGSGITFTDKEIEPIKFQVYDEFDMESLRATRFGVDMKAGASNLVSGEFDKAVLDWAQPRLARAIEKKYWEMATADLTSASNEITVAGATLTPANLVAEMTKVYSAIPGEVLESGQALIYAPLNVRQMVQVINQDTSKFTNAFLVTGQDVEFMGVKVVFVPIAANTMFAGLYSDFILGTDLVSDFAQFEVNKVSNASDLMFMKATLTLDAAVVIPSQKVRYSA